MRTEAELITEALQVQHACNLSGVVHAFSRAMTDLWELAHLNHNGTEWVNTHPVAKLFAEKVMHLCRGELPITDYIHFSNLYLPKE